MICGMCGKRMKVGRFKVETHSTGYAYSTVSWYEGNELVFESPQTETTGFFCEDCGIAMGGASPRSTPRIWTMTSTPSPKNTAPSAARRSTSTTQDARIADIFSKANSPLIFAENYINGG